MKQRIFNVTPSLALGFYEECDDAIEVGAIVSVRALDVIAPDVARAAVGPMFPFLRPNNLRMLKRVRAIAGSVVEAFDETVLIDGVYVGSRLSPILAKCAIGFEWPMWTGTHTLEPDEVFLLAEGANADYDERESMDSRYLGPINRGLIEKTWRRKRLETTWREHIEAMRELEHHR